MKKVLQNLMVSLIIFTCILVGGCREETIDVPAYGGKYANFEPAEASLTGLFNSIWMAMNCNYPIWDYEKDKYNVDWDDVYRDYFPKFEELDHAYFINGEYVNKQELNDTVKKLYTEIFGLLHDGHTQLSIYHEKSGIYCHFEPNNDRIRRRSDYVGWANNYNIHR